MTQEDAVNYWLTSAEHNCQVAKDLFESGHYDWSLFMWHLVIEKTLKAILASRGHKPYPIHDLARLADKAELSLSKEKVAVLEEITTFNLEARYDDYKFKFYKKATQEFTTKWVKKAQKIYQCLKKQL
jgi:HEPN domain-containing protein